MHPTLIGIGFLFGVLLGALLYHQFFEMRLVSKHCKLFERWKQRSMSDAELDFAERDSVTIWESYEPDGTPIPEEYIW